MLKKFFFLLLIICPLSTFADQNKENIIIFNCDKKEVNINEDVTCRISINSETEYSQVDFDFSYSEEIKLIDVRSNYSNLWKVDNNENHITAKISTKESKTGLQEFGIILLRPKQSGVFELGVNNVKTDTETLKDVKTNIKVISTNNNVTKINVNDEELQNFLNSEKIYNIETKEEKIKINIEPENEFAKVEGNGEYVFPKNESELIIPIKVTSESGNVNSFVLRFTHKLDNEIQKQLSGIIIKDSKGSNLLINFEKDIYEYYLDVSSDIDYLEFKPSLDNENLSFVKDYGEQKVKLNYGENIVQIKIKDENKNIKTYIIFVTKTILNADSNNYLKDIIIEDYKLEFNKRVKKYTLEVKSNTKKLNINPILASEKASYIIKGNNDIKNNSVIKIIVTAENEAKTTYQIIIKYKQFNYFKLIVTVLLITSLGYFIYKQFIKNKKAIIIKYKKTKKYSQTASPKKKNNTSSAKKQTTQKRNNQSKTKNSHQNQKKSQKRKTVAKKKNNKKSSKKRR